MDLVYCGAIFRDLVTYTPGFPAEGETKFGSKYQTGFGGKSSNQAVMAAKLGAKVAMIGRLGNDDNGKAYLDNYRRVGVACDDVTLDDENSSGVACIWVDTTSGQNEIIIVPGANQSLSKEKVAAAGDVIATAKALGVSLEANVEGTLEAMTIARRAGVKVMLNAAPGTSDKTVLDPMLELTDILIVNETEAALITGIPEGEETIDLVLNNLAKLVPTVILTLGSKGAALATSADSTKTTVISRVPAAAAPEVAWKVVDTTGAGDAFVGALMYFVFVMNLNLEEATKRACHIASDSVQREGTQSSYLSKEELPISLFR